jgi:hypothetical protein
LFSKYGNENGSALIYVLMISFVLMIFVPAILTTVSNTQASDLRIIHQKKATTLAVSGMREFVNYTGTKVDQKQYLETNYGLTNIHSPGGEAIDFYQYAVSLNDLEEYSHAISLNDFKNLNESYKVIFAAISGDTNHNRVKDDGERFFYKKHLVHRVVYSTIRTPVPIISPLPYGGETEIIGESVAGATITVMDNQGVLNTTAANESGNFSITTRPLITGEMIRVTAKTKGKLQSLTASVDVLQRNEEVESDGLVKIIDEQGNVEYEYFQDIQSTVKKMVVTSSVGTYSTSNKIELTAESGLTIEEGVSLTTDSNGNEVGLTLTTTKGDITINNITLEDLANSSFNQIKIEAAGDVYMDNSILYAVRYISIKAGGNIYASNTILSNDKNFGAISFELTGTGTIYVDGLSITEPATASPSDVKICGQLANDSRINGINNYTCN